MFQLNAFRIAFAAVLTAFAVTAAPATAAVDDLSLVSRQSVADGGAAADSVSVAAVTSGDGRYVAFISSADNLSAEDDDNFDNVFVRDMQDGSLLLASRSDGLGGIATDGNSNVVAISANGRYVVFQSEADNLSSDDDDAFTNVYVRDIAIGQTSLVSRQSDSDGGLGADNNSYDATISADGRYIAFYSEADNLSADDDVYEDVFVRDTVTATTTLISRQSPGDGGVAADGRSSSPAISSDGRFVAFVSAASNLSVDDSNGAEDIYRMDLDSGAVDLVSRLSAADGGSVGADASYAPSISSDGSRVVFMSDADNLSSIDNDFFQNIFARDLTADSTTLVSVQNVADGGSGADDGSLNPTISGDGKFVVFESNADNLSALDLDAYSNIFVQKLSTSECRLVSRQSAVDGGAPADADSGNASVSDDGRFVVFQSDADNLSTGDDDSATNVFLRDVLGAAQVPNPPTPPSSPVANPEPLVPGLQLVAPPTAKLGRAFGVKSGCSNASCRISISAMLTMPNGKRYRLSTASATVSVGRLASFPVVISKKTLKLVRRGLKKRQSATITVTAAAKDSRGLAASASWSVKLSR